MEELPPSNQERTGEPAGHEIPNPSARARSAIATHPDLLCFLVFFFSDFFFCPGSGHAIHTPLGICPAWLVLPYETLCDAWRDSTTTPTLHAPDRPVTL